MRYKLERFKVIINAEASDAKTMYFSNNCKPERSNNNEIFMVVSSAVLRQYTPQYFNLNTEISLENQWHFPNGANRDGKPAREVFMKQFSFSELLQF